MLAGRFLAKNSWAPIADSVIYMAFFSGSHLSLIVLVLLCQVSHQGHPIKDGFCSGFPQDSPAAFVSQLSAGAVVYFQR